MAHQPARIVVAVGCLVGAWLACPVSVRGAAPANPGFEAATAGRPDGWNALGHPAYAAARADAPEGTAYVRVGRLHWYQQSVPAIPGIAHAALAVCRGARGGEVAVTTDWFPLGADWRPIVDSFTPGPGQDRWPLLATALWSDDWIEVDDWRLFDEFLEEDGYAADGAFVRQTVAVEIGGKTYTLSGRIAADAPADATLELAWLDGRLEVVRTEFFTVPADTQWAPFAVSVVPPPYNRFASHSAFPDDAVLCRIGLATAAGGTAIRHETVQWTWIAVLPVEFTPDGDGHRDRGTVFWSVPRPGAWQVSVRCATAAVIRTATRAVETAGVASFDWDGRDSAGDVVPPGTYTIEVAPLDGEALPAALAAGVTVAVAPARPPFRRFDDWLPLGAWYSVPWYRIPDEAALARDFATLADAGFNAVYLMNNPGLPAAAVAEAARAAGLRLFFGADFFAFNRYAQHTYGDVPPGVVRRQLEQLYDELGDRSVLAAHVVWDEPGADLMPLLETYSRVLASLSPDVPPVSVVAVPDDRDGFLAATRSPVFLFDRYPYHIRERIGGFGWLAAELRTVQDTARAAGVPWWLMTSAHTEEGIYRAATPAEQRRVLYEGMAQGACGFFYFFANPLPWETEVAAGLLDSAGTMQYPEIRTMNRVLDQLAPLLLDWSPVAPLASAPYRIHVGSLRSSTGMPYLVVVNQDCLRNVTAAVTIDATTARSAVNVRTGERLAIDDRRLALPLAAGDAAILRLEEATAPPAPAAAPPPEPAAQRTVVEPVGRALTAVQGLDRVAARGNIVVVGQFLHSGPNRRPVYLVDASDPRALVPGAVFDAHRADRFALAGAELWLSDGAFGLVRCAVRSATEVVEVERFAHRPGNAMGVAFDAERVYVAARSAGVRVLRRDATGELLLEAETAGEVDAGAVAVVGERLVALAQIGPSGIYDLGASPRLDLLGTLPAVSHVVEAATHRGLVYAAALDNGLLVVDPARAPAQALVYRDDTLEARGLALHGRSLLLADGAGGLRVYSLADPGRPRWVRTVIHEPDATVDGVAVEGQIVYVCSRNGGLFALPLEGVLPRASVFSFTMDHMGNSRVDPIGLGPPN